MNPFNVLIKIPLAFELGQRMTIKVRTRSRTKSIKKLIVIFNLYNIRYLFEFFMNVS
jgi:hypothetical protein